MTESRPGGRLHYVYVEFSNGYKHAPHFTLCGSDTDVIFYQHYFTCKILSINLPQITVNIFNSLLFLFLDTAGLYLVFVFVFSSTIL